MKKLIIRLGIVFSLFLIYALPALFILLAFKELITPDAIIKIQNDRSRHSLVGLAYSDPMKYVKLKAISLRRPEVVSFGGSVVLQLRESFFKAPSKFYNAGLAVGKLKQFRIFLKLIPRSDQPKVILMGLVPFYFHPMHYELEEKMNLEKEYTGKDNYFEAWFYGTRGVYLNWISSKFKFRDIKKGYAAKDKIGLNAIVNNNGFRNDGSYLYGEIISDPKNSEDYNFANTFKRIDDGNRRFEYSEELSEGAVRELNLFLEDCKSRNIYVIAFLCPFPPSVYEKIKSMGNKYAYMFKLEAKLKPVFNKYGYGFYDFSNSSELGGSDKEVIDGLHCSEKTYLRLFIELAENEEKLRNYVDIEYLKARLSAAKSDLLVF